MHYNEKIDLIWRLPQYINIGPFALNVDSLKVLSTLSRIATLLGCLRDVTRHNDLH